MLAEDDCKTGHNDGRRSIRISRSLTIVVREDERVFERRDLFVVFQTVRSLFYSETEPISGRVYDPTKITIAHIIFNEIIRRARR